jgi:hypothetical protein
MRKRAPVVLAVLAAAMLLPGGTTVAAADHSAPVSGKPSHELAKVKEATARFHSVWEAKAAGYELASPCVPEMGFHFVQSVAAGQDELVPTEPNALVYAPTPNGGLKLVAVEYASETPATLFGQDFDPPGAVPFHTLHAWIWKDNPRGVFHPTNPHVSCDAGHEHTDHRW